MFKISVEQFPWSTIQIQPMSIKRDWMDNTSENHAYRCFPVTQANVIGSAMFFLALFIVIAGQFVSKKAKVSK